MFRLFIPLGFFVIFLTWLVYRLVIKKDLKQNMITLYLGLSFILVWMIIYYFLLY